MQQLELEFGEEDVFFSIQDLPIAIRGVIFNYSRWLGNSHEPVYMLQKWLCMEPTGVVDQKTCTLAQSMVELDGAQEAINSLCEYLIRKNVGPKYLFSQHMFEGGTLTEVGIGKIKPGYVRFNKENYGEYVND